MEREWENEPDEIEWIDRSTELRCLVLRPFPVDLGNLCGYVAIPEGHPLHAVEYTDTAFDVGIDCHGGITFSGQLPNRNGWWVGFDCGHYGDVVPKMVDLFPGVTLLSERGVYRNVAFVRGECEKVARHVNDYRRSE